MQKLSVGPVELTSIQPRHLVQRPPIKPILSH